MRRHIWRRNSPWRAKVPHVGTTQQQRYERAVKLLNSLPEVARKTKIASMKAKRSRTAPSYSASAERRRKHKRERQARRLAR